jgi:PST family polysaccharide transporter
MDSAMVFSSIILVPLYSSVNIFILRYFTNPLIVGYYAVADKIYGAISMLTSVANRTFYPHLAMLYKNSVSAFHSQVRKIVLLFLAAFSLFAIIQFAGAAYILELVSGKSGNVNPIVSVGLLKIMSLATLFAPYGSFFFQLLIIQGRKKSAVRNLFAVVLINTISAITLSSTFGAEGMAVNLCIIVILVALFNFLSYRTADNILK